MDTNSNEDYSTIRVPLLLQRIVPDNKMPFSKRSLNQDLD